MKKHVLAIEEMLSEVEVQNVTAKVEVGSLMELIVGFRALGYRLLSGDDPVVFFGQILQVFEFEEGFVYPVFYKDGGIAYSRSISGAKRYISSQSRGSEWYDATKRISVKTEIV